MRTKTSRDKKCGGPSPLGKPWRILLTSWGGGGPESGVGKEKGAKHVRVAAPGAKLPTGGQLGRSLGKKFFRKDQKERGSAKSTNQRPDGVGRSGGKEKKIGSRPTSHWFPVLAGPDPTNEGAHVRTGKAPWARHQASAADGQETDRLKWREGREGHTSRSRGAGGRLLQRQKGKSGGTKARLTKLERK